MQKNKRLNLMQLGKLKRVDLRTVWENEPRNFTNWLSKEENLNLLGEEIGIDVSFIKTETSHIAMFFYFKK